MNKHLHLFIFGLIMTFIAYSQDQVTGVVTDDQGEPVIGATIQEKGTRNFAVTSVGGTFTLKLEQELPVSLQISAVGLKKQEIEIYEVTGEPITVGLRLDNVLDAVTVTARRRSETALEVPIPISVVSGALVDQAGAFNVNRVKELIPSVQLYSSNPRNTGINIRGIGSPYGLTNDGLDPGVGFYVDGVYFARPAAATLDFIDIERIEVLRGPQGTLFGKNTTAGAFNITTRQASFTPGVNFEVSYGNYGFVQAKSSITGPIVKGKLAGRFSFSGTQRDGTVYNVAKDEYVNDINNLGYRGQLLFTPTEKIKLTLTGDNTKQNPNGYAQVVAGVVTTERAEYRQFDNIVADLNYTLPSTDPFDRVIDHDTPWRSLNELGGVSLSADIELGAGTLTATGAWRYWNWGPSNDRDFTGLQALAKSQNPSEQLQSSAEIRYATEFSNNLSGVIGLFFIDQEVETHGREEAGVHQWRFSQSTMSVLWATPGLLEGYGISTESSIKSQSAAVFANADWAISKKLHIQPGVRFNYDVKDVTFDRKAELASWGETFADHPDRDALLALRRGVYSSQYYTANADETNFTYLLSLSYAINERYNAYGTYSTSFKPIGVNVAGVPNITGANGTSRPDSTVFVIKPEYVQHVEFGIKTNPTDQITFNATFFNTDIDDYQANVQAAQLGVNRGYIANADKVNVRGAEVDFNFTTGKNFNLFGALTYTEGTYEKFVNAPLPLEETGHTIVNDEGQTVQQAFKDVSGGRLPGISKSSGSLGTELATNEIGVFGQRGRLFLAVEGFFRSEFSSSASPSQYLNVDGYGLLNARTGFRANEGLSIIVWSRNLTNKDYFEQLLAAGGNAGHYAAVLGDPRTYGVTLKYSF